MVTRALNSLQGGDEPNIKVVYGDGSFGSGGSSERSVPVKWFKEATKNRFRDTFQEVDEHHLSRIYPECGIQLYSVIEYFNDKSMLYEGQCDVAVKNVEFFSRIVMSALHVTTCFIDTWMCLQLSWNAMDLDGLIQNIGM